jgi:putative membrane protein
VTLITSIVAAALLAIGGISGVNALEAEQAAATEEPGPITVIAALVFGAIRWFAAAGVTSSLGRVTDEYLDGDFNWRYLNAPFYVVAIAVVLHGVSAFILDTAELEYMAVMLTGGTLLALASTLSFAVAESWAERQTGTV